MNRSAPPFAWALLIGLGVIWGSSFLFTGIAVKELPPTTVVGLRLALAAALVWIIAQAIGARPPRLKTPDGRRLWKFAAAAAVTSNIAPFLLISWGQQHIPSALSGLLMAPMPLMALALSHFLVSGEQMTKGRFIGFAIGFGGVVYLIGTEAVAQLGRGDTLALIAQLGTLMAAFCYAISSIVLKRAEAPDALGISVIILAIAAVVTIPMGMIAGGADVTTASWLTLLAITSLGIGSTALAQLMMLKIIQLAGPPFLSLVNYQVPLWAVVFGVAFLGETLPGSFWIALALILAGIAVAQVAGRKPRKLTIQ